MSAGATDLKGLAAIPVAQIHPSPGNPRKHMTGINDLAASIRTTGLIQPLVVQRIPGGGFQIVAGHRRFAACKSLGMTSVPCLIRRDLLPDEELVAMVVENNQRAALDPIEEARALAKLKQQTGIDHKGLGKLIGRSDAFVSNRLALLKLTVTEQEEIRAGQLTKAEAIQRVRVKKAEDSGRPVPQVTRGWWFSGTHPLADAVKDLCRRLEHDGGRKVGGIGCGECWETTVRADERKKAGRG